jgi:hypothetical protein
MRIIHNINYDVTAQLEFRKIVYQNIIRVGDMFFLVSPEIVFKKKTTSFS